MCRHERRRRQVLGSNRFGQLGNDVQRKCNSHGRCDQPFNRAPVGVVGLSSGVTAVAAGGSHTCALTSEGAVKCWGYNARGQLGNGAKPCSSVATCERNASSRPVDVVGLTGGVTAIAAGEFHTCALMRSGGVKCWGSNTGGQLGTGGQVRVDSSSTPRAVVGLDSGVTAIAARGGAPYTCAIVSGGEVSCWGVVLTPVAGLGSGIKAISIYGTTAAAGSSLACAVTSADGVRCWGDNYYGQLGDGSRAIRRTPVDVVALDGGVTAVSAGGAHTCALTTAGGVKCWGANAFGALGNGSTTLSSRPVAVVGLASGVSEISVGSGYACALTRDGRVKCWGANFQGRLGSGSKARSSATPVDVLFTAQPAAKPRTPPTAGSTAAGTCSKAEATAVVKRLHLGEADFIPNPVYAVICSSLMGPGSTTMVVSLATGGTSVPFGGWLVFRKVGATWQLVLRRNDGAEISAAEGGIREKKWISLPGDSRCCPSGGSRSRIWRWSGTRFTASAWRQAAVESKKESFYSPSRKHRVRDVRRQHVTRLCELSEPQASPQSVTLDAQRSGSKHLPRPDAERTSPTSATSAIPGEGVIPSARLRQAAHGRTLPLPVSTGNRRRGAR